TERLLRWAYSEAGATRWACASMIMCRSLDLTVCEYEVWRVGLRNPGPGGILLYAPTGQDYATLFHPCQIFAPAHRSLLRGIEAIGGRGLRSIWRPAFRAPRLRYPGPGRSGLARQDGSQHVTALPTAEGSRALAKRSVLVVIQPL